MASAHSINPQNPYGIHFLRAVTSFGLIAVHAVAWTLYFGGYRVDTFNTSMIIIGSVICISGITPIVAGAAQALYLQNHVRGTKLVSVPFAKIISALVFLIFIEDLKSAVVFGPGMFFAWNVTHVISVSLVLTLVLARISVYCVFATAAACIAVTPLVRKILSPYQLVSPATIDLINSSTIPFQLCLAAVSIVFATLAIVLWASPRLPRTLKLRTTGILFFAYSVFVYLASRADFYPQFAVRILNFPIGALIGDQLGYHSWPLFPWYSIVAGGFLYFYVLMTTAYPRGVRLGFAVLTASSLYVYYVYYHQNISAEMDPRNIWSSKILAAADLSQLYWTFGAFSLVALISDALSTAPWMDRRLAQHPVFFETTLVFSRSIFWVYIFMNTVGVLIAYPIAKMVPLNIALALYLPLCFYLNHLMGRTLVYWMGTKQIRIRLSRA